VTDESWDEPSGDPDEDSQAKVRDADVSELVERAAAMGFDPDRVSNALGVQPGRDERASDRDDAADSRDMHASSRDGMASDDESMTERERDAQRLAQEDREAAEADRREAGADRASAAEARDASRRSGE
jgi:hypothetical protein